MEAFIFIKNEILGKNRNFRQTKILVKNRRFWSKIEILVQKFKYRSKNRHFRQNWKIRKIFLKIYISIKNLNPLFLLFSFV